MNILLRNLVVAFFVCTNTLSLVAMEPGAPSQQTEHRRTKRKREDTSSTRAHHVDEQSEEPIDVVAPEAAAAPAPQQSIARRVLHHVARSGQRIIHAIKSFFSPDQPDESKSDEDEPTEPERKRPRTETPPTEMLAAPAPMPATSTEMTVVQQPTHHQLDALSRLPDALFIAICRFLLPDGTFREAQTLLTDGYRDRDYERVLLTCGLREAVYQNNAATAQIILSRRYPTGHPRAGHLVCHVNNRIDFGLTPLLRAILKNEKDLVQLFLSIKGPDGTPEFDVHHTSSYGETPLDFAIYFKHPEIEAMLRAAGAMH